ncbi:aminopeptidase [Acetobacterium paludosum]|uniref:M18 family aminopeptidase n=1 Tax=Acetobacterium paludosum TaxID=52693 RepID=A0A923KW49_9FIRM|nr:aminopeptidase [Acetobacterium paludosum]MBC3887673.1 aminopeptidase [Acetobacterium paludosum]
MSTEEKEKTPGILLQEQLTKKWEIAWNDLDEEETHKMKVISDEYLSYLTSGKTERQCVEISIKMAEKAGFKPLDDYKKSGKIIAGDKIYMVHKGKTIVLFIAGTDSIENGMAIVGAHIDAPRLDLKPTPLYESDDMAFFKTHYYGGIKKYHWVTIPLAMHGTVVKKDGETINLSIGEALTDPVFCITDLLPHLSQEQNAKKMNEGITGEGLNIIVGSQPYKEKDLKEGVKLNILNILHEKYGMVEEDFATAELEVVPAGAARNVGFDESLVGSYGQDDRICAYTALKAILERDNPKRTLCVILADKEEIGSCGNTGMHSLFFENSVAEMIDLMNIEKPEMVVRRCLMNSEMLSADVTAGVDPNFSGTHDKNNAPYIGKGIVLSKYGGSRGKSGSNDAHAEFMGKMRKTLDNAGVVWQMGELGRVDLGGGGTIAYILAKYGMDVLDCGPALLSMHAPFELASKVDVYMCYKGYKAFLV